MSLITCIPIMCLCAKPIFRDKRVSGIYHNIQAPTLGNWDQMKVGDSDRRTLFPQYLWNPTSCSDNLNACRKRRERRLIFVHTFSTFPRFSPRSARGPDHTHTLTHMQQSSMYINVHVPSASRHSMSGTGPRVTTHFPPLILPLGK